MTNMVVATTESPPKRFWTNGWSLLARGRVLDGDGELHRWIDDLSGQQIRMLCLLLGLNHEDSIQKLRPLLYARADDLAAFFLVTHFAKGKTEVAVVEVARESLSPHLVELCIRQPRKRGQSANGDDLAEDRYDKNALLFALYNKNRNLLKEVLHFDKVHKKGFASMVLAEAPKSPPKTAFHKFLAESRVSGIIQSYQRSRRDGSVSELQGIWTREGRRYVFIRRTDRPAHIHDGKRGILHGYDVEWIVLDFSPDADQVNIASNSVDEPKEMANRIASAYFRFDCRFVNEETLTAAKTIEQFIGEARGNSNGIGLVEVCVGNSPLRGSSKVRISNENAKALGESLDHFDSTVGNIMENLSDVEGVKVLYRRKRVGLQFDQDESGDGQYVVRYTDQRLNAFERRRFEQEMRDNHDISVLSTEKR